MEDKDLLLPFVNRSMLSFQYAANFEVAVGYISEQTADFTVTIATKDGLFKYDIKPVVDTQVTVQTFPIADIPIWVSVVDKFNQIDKGELFVSVTLKINKNLIQTLCAGYVYNYHGISYPITETEHPGGNRGKITQAGSTNPAAGSEFSFQIPANESWRLIAIRFTLVTSSSVASRRVHVTMDMGSGNFVEAMSATDQAASTTVVYTCMAPGAGMTLANDNDVVIPLPPDLYLPPGTTIHSETVNKQSGDDFSFAEFTYERHYEFTS